MKTPKNQSKKPTTIFKKQSRIIQLKNRLHITKATAVAVSKIA